MFLMVNKWCGVPFHVRDCCLMCLNIKKKRSFKPIDLITYLNENRIYFNISVTDWITANGCLSDQFVL